MLLAQQSCGSLRRQHVVSPKGKQMPTRSSILRNRRAAFVVVGLVLFGGDTAAAQQNSDTLQQRKDKLEVERLGLEVDKLKQEVDGGLQQRKAEATKLELEAKKLELEARKLDDDLLWWS